MDKITEKSNIDVMRAPILRFSTGIVSVINQFDVHEELMKRHVRLL